MTLTIATPKKIEAAAEQRQEHESAAQALLIKARECAEAGMISEAGSFILKALGHERRASAAGPQVLQLIKPRT